MPQETCTGTLFASEATRPVNQTRNKPLESHENLGQPAAKALNYLVNHAAAHQRLADYGVLRPQGSMGEQITDGYSQVVIGVHQPRRWGDDSMPVGVGVVSKCDLILVFESDQPG